jgi:hypothetical protein
VRERPVGFGHLLQVLAALHRGADPVARVEQLGGETIRSAADLSRLV